MFLPRDPQWAVVYWKIDTSDRQRALARGGKDLCLRVADVTDLVGMDDVSPHHFQEIVMEASASEWYLPVPVCGRDYRVELGYRTDALGGWFSLACSSAVRIHGISAGEANLVRHELSTFSNFTPMAKNRERLSEATGLHEKLYQRGAAPWKGHRNGSEVFHAPGAHLQGANGHEISGSGVWSDCRSESGGGGVPRRRRLFRLVVDAELIVYGATDPAAHLTIGGEPVPLSADGTFHLKMGLPDGQQSYPIEAFSADGLQRRNTTMEFQRRTMLDDGKEMIEDILEWF